MRRIGHGLLPVAACTVALTILGACGSSSPPLSAGASTELAHEVAAVRSAVTAHNPGSAAALLSQLRARVDALESQGQISKSRADPIRASIAQVTAQLATLTPAPAPSPTAAPAPAPVVPPAPPGDGKGKGKGNGGDGGGGGD